MPIFLDVMPTYSVNVCVNISDIKLRKARTTWMNTTLLAELTYHTLAPDWNICTNVLIFRFCHVIYWQLLINVNTYAHIYIYIKYQNICKFGNCHLACNIPANISQLNPLHSISLLHWFVAIQFKLIQLCLIGENRFDLWLLKTAFTYECYCYYKFRFLLHNLWPFWLKIVACSKCFIFNSITSLVLSKKKKLLWIMCFNYIFADSLILWIIWWIFICRFSRWLISR